MARSKRSAIAIQLTHQAAHLLQLEFKRDEGKVAAMAEVKRPHEDTPEGDAWAAEIAGALKTRGFKGRAAVACVPPEKLLLRHVKVPAEAGQELHDALLFEVEDAFSDDAPMMEHLHVGEVLERGERLHEHILMATGHEQMLEIVDFLTRAGLEPTCIDVEAAALIRCFLRRRRRRTDESDTAIVHIGESITLAVITSANQPLFMKQLPMGAAALRSELRQKLDLSTEDLRHATSDPDAAEDLREPVVQALRLQVDTVVQEVSACLRYHAASRRSPAGVDLVLCGVGTLVPGFADVVAEGLGQGYSRPNPFTPAYSGVEPIRAIEGRYGEWCVPLGLALRGVDA